MKIPDGKNQREEFYIDLASRALASRNDRVALYDSLKNYYLWGNNNQTDPVEYNKLYAHVDLLASFLFSGETTSFVIEVDEGEDGDNADFENQKASKVTPAINRVWHRSNLDIVFNEALIWSLVFSTMFIKLVPRKKGALDAYCVEPHAIGVLLEHENMMDKQPVIVHEFLMTKSDLLSRIKHLPEEDQKMILSLATFRERTIDSTTTPQPQGVNNLIVAASSPNVQGNIINPIAIQYGFNPQINEECCTVQEMWVWDDDMVDRAGKPCADYNRVLLIEGVYMLFDSHRDRNPFVDNEHPFVKITPNQIYNYFWGRTEMMYLIPIQEWVNERVPEIKKHIQKQTNPPKSASGFTSLQEEKMAALDNAGGFLFEPTPVTARVEQHFPAPINVFEVLDRADQMFAEISGIRDLMQGKGESGVRAMSHANLLVRVGSSRVKKKAAVLEDAVEKIGHLILKIMQRYDPTHYSTDNNTQFVADQLTSNLIVKVDSHSSSPIFIEQQMDKAQLLFKARAIDEEDLIDAVKPQNPGMLKRKLRERKKKEEPISQIASMVEDAKTENAADVLGKLKNLLKLIMKGRK